MEPASSIVAKLGGAAKTAKLLGTHRTRVYAWTYPRDRGGTGGVVPQVHHRAILRAATELGVEIKAEDLLPVEMANSE